MHHTYFQKSVSHRTTYKHKHVLWIMSITVTKSVLFWNFMQLRIATFYRRFGRYYQSHLQNSRSLKRIAFVCLNFKDGTEDFYLNCLTIDRQVVPKRGYESAIRGWVKFRKSAELIYTVAEDWSRNTDMHRLTTGIRSEKCVVRRFRRCANVLECTYTNLDSTV
jgi:hypothetical protein